MGLGSVELVMECEDEFDIKISDFEAQQVETVGQLQELCVRLVQKQVQSLELAADAKDMIREEVRKIISEQLGEKIHKVVPEAHFVNDLKLY
tara:strand:- start:190 stop:465 length:276 start_codon:yes stop_codon:yes gene_type:complete